MAVYVFGEAFHNRHSCAGFSIVEVLVTLGISAFLALGSGMLITQSAKEQVRLERSSDAKALADQIYRTCFSGKQLQSPCTFSGNVDIAAAGDLDGVPITLNVPMPGGALNLSAGAETRFGTIERVQLAQLECLNRNPDGTEIGAATLRLSVRVGGNANSSTSTTKEVNVGRFPLRMTGTGAVCTGNRTIQPAVAQTWGAVSASLCATMGLEIDDTGESCRVPASHIFGRTNPGPCGPNEHVNSVRPVVADGHSQAECREFPAQGCRSNQLAVGFENGNLVCAAEPPAIQVTGYPTVTQVPPQPQPTAYQPPSPTPQVIPTGTDTANIGGYECIAQRAYQDCIVAVSMGAGSQFGITEADCGPAPTCGTTVAEPTPNSATPYPTATPTPTVVLVTPPANNSCLCGGQTVLHGRYCGYCVIIMDYEPEPYYRYPISYQNVRDAGLYNYRSSSVVQCLNGQLVSTTETYRLTMGCTGEYVNW